MEAKGQGNIQTIAIGALVFLLILVVYGSVVGALNFGGFTAAVTTLIALIPLVLVGALIIGIVASALIR